MRLVGFFLAFIITVSSIFAQAQEKANSRFEELLIWKLTDELKLDVEHEKRFDETLRSLNVRKKSAAENLAKALLELKQGLGSKKQTDLALAHYKMALVKLQKLQLGENDEIQKALGAEKLAQYLVIKAEITENLKQALLAPSEGSSGKGGTSAAPTAPTAKATATPLPSPKLIEQGN